MLDYYRMTKRRGMAGQEVEINSPDVQEHGKTLYGVDRVEKRH